MRGDGIADPKRAPPVLCIDPNDNTPGMKSRSPRMSTGHTPKLIGLAPPNETTRNVPSGSIRLTSMAISSRCAMIRTGEFVSAPDRFPLIRPMTLPAGSTQVSSQCGSSSRRQISRTSCSCPPGPRAISSSSSSGKVDGLDCIEGSLLFQVRPADEAGRDVFVFLNTAGAEKFDRILAKLTSGPCRRADRRPVRRVDRRAARHHIAWVAPTPKGGFAVSQISWSP